MTTPHYLYRAYDADGLLLYIGCTSEPHRRIAAHKRGAKGRASRLLQVCATRYEVDADTYPNMRAGRDAEARAIYDEEPLLNVEHQADTGARVHINTLRYLADRGISRDGLVRSIPDLEAAVLGVTPSG